MFFETYDLIANELTLNDLSRWYEIENQPYILKWMPDWKMNLDETAALLRHFITGYSQKDPSRIPFVCAIRLKETCRLIGMCGFGPKEELGGKVELCYFIDQAYSNKGFMSQAVEKAVDFYFQLTQSPVLFALADPANTASVRLLQKNNFILVAADPDIGISQPHYRKKRIK